MIVNNNEPTTLWKRYLDAVAYQTRMGLTSLWQECEDFVEGKHWPKATPRTRNMPRPVINLCAMIAENKKSNILSSKIKIIYRPHEVFFDIEKAAEGASLFTKFAENTLKELKQEDLDDIIQDYATQLGSYGIHYYWDNEVTGGTQSPFIGAVRGEVLHPKNVLFANPAQKDIQKQEWIQIISDEPIESVRNRAKKNGISNWYDIKADNESDQEEFRDKQVCRVITQYSRKNGKVVWEQATKDVQIQEPTYWEPNLNKHKIKDRDIEEAKEPDKPSQEKNRVFEKQLYPIVFESHKNRKDSIYGQGEVEQAIPNNKEVNFGIGMMLLSVQQTAWPKILQKAGALAKQKITNTPGEILTDYSRGNGSGWGITYMNTSNFNPQALQITNTLIDLTRTTTGSTEVVTGEVLGANMAASAIIALQNQAKKPVEMYQKRYYRTYEKIGAIMLQFFKCYYNDGRLFSYEEDGHQYLAQMNGSNYDDYDYSMNIEVGAGGQWSESLSIGLLDNLKQAGDIDTDDYIELYPDSIMPFKKQLKQIRERKKEEQYQQMLLQQQTQSTMNIPNNITNPVLNQQ